MQKISKGPGENRDLEKNRLGLDCNRVHKNTRWASLELPNNLAGRKCRGTEKILRVMRE